MLSKTVLNAIALTTTAVWTLSFVAQFIPALNYKPDPQISIIFGTLVGGAFMLPKLLKRGDEPGGRHHKNEDDE